MRSAFPLLAATTAAFLAAGLWPRPGQPALLVMPAAAAAGAFGDDAWRPRRIEQLGPFVLVTAFPATPEAEPSNLARVSGALLVIAAGLRPGCD